MWFIQKPEPLALCTLVPSVLLTSQSGFSSSSSLQCVTVESDDAYTVTSKAFKMYVCASHNLLSNYVFRCT